MFSFVYGTTERTYNFIEWLLQLKLTNEFRCYPGDQDSKLCEETSESPQLDKYKTKIWNLSSYLLPFA